MSEQNKTISRTLIDNLWNKKDMTIADKLIAPNQVPHGPFTDQFPSGPEGMKAFTSSFLAAFPDVKATIDSQEDDGDMVKTTVTFRGTHTGQLMDIPATGKKATVKVIVTDRIAGGKIVESWTEWDPNDMLRQLGVSAP
jgi:predicted ester cyclase